MNKRHVVLLATVGALFAALTPPAQAATKNDDGQAVTVMSRNLFLGVDIRRAAGPKTPEELGDLSVQLYNEVQATDPQSRMKLAADEIAKVKPDLVGLQEVTLWQAGPRTIDYLALIQAELKAKKADYRVVKQESEADVKVATPEGQGRFMLGNAVLARKGVKTSGVRSKVFKEQISLPTAIGVQPVHRNYISMKAKVGNTSFDYVNTHLEAFSNAQKVAQAQELAKGPLKAKGPALLTGDLNSNKNLPVAADREAFAAVAKAGFVVRQTSKQTCCLNDDLKTGVRDHTVDFVMSKPKLKLLKSGLVGLTDMTPAGTQISDHAGVWSTLLVP